MKVSAKKWWDDWAEQAGISAGRYSEMQSEIEAYCAARPWFPEQILDPVTIEKIKRDPSGAT